MVKKYLSLDLGTKTLGIAYNDALGFVHGLETFRFDKNQYIVARKHVIELSEKMMINDIVIGLPLHLSGEESEMSQNVKRFIEDLKKEKPALNIETMDERLSSVTANKSISERGMNHQQRKDTGPVQMEINEVFEKPAFVRFGIVIHCADKTDVDHVHLVRIDHLRLFGPRMQSCPEHDERLLQIVHEFQQIDLRAFDLHPGAESFGEARNTEFLSVGLIQRVQQQPQCHRIGYLVAFDNVLEHHEVIVLLQDFDSGRQIGRAVDFGKSAELEIVLHFMTEVRDIVIGKVFRDGIKDVVVL